MKGTEEWSYERIRPQEGTSISIDDVDLDRSLSITIPLEWTVTSRGSPYLSLPLSLLPSLFSSSLLYSSPLKGIRPKWNEKGEFLPSFSSLILLFNGSQSSLLSIFSIIFLLLLNLDDSFWWAFLPFFLLLHFFFLIPKGRVLFSFLTLLILHIQLNLLNRFIH